MVRMKGQEFAVTVHQKAFIFLGAMLIAITALAIIYLYVNPTLANTPKARASLTAHTLTFYLSSLSSVDAGVMEKNLNETYTIQIGKYSGFKRFWKTDPVNNYYLRVFLYDKKGELLAESEDVSFIGNLDIECDKSGPCLETEKITFVMFTKRPGEAVKLEGFKTVEESGFTFCEEPKRDEVERYVREYSTKYRVEKPLVLAVMASESYMEHCDRYGYVKHSLDRYGNPIAFGLMQVTPSTARTLEGKHNVEINVENPEQNVMGGVLLLSDLLEDYEGYDDQKELAVANYNCGGIAEAVGKYCTDKENCWEKVKPHLGRGKEFCTASDETIPYVEKVMRLYECFGECLKTQADCYSIDYCRSAWSG